MSKKINEIAKAPLSFGSGAFFVGFEVFGAMSNFIRVIFGMSSPTILRVMRICVDLGGEQDLWDLLIILGYLLE